MTQYNPTPYQGQPQMSGYAQADPYAAQGAGGNLKMCRAAAIAQIAMGAMICLLAFCLLAFGAIVIGGALPAGSQEQFAEITKRFGDAAGIVFVLAGVCAGLPGLGQIILGFFVWRGSKASLIGSMVVAGLFGGFMLLNMAALISTGGTQEAAGICMNVFMLAMVAGLVALLVMAYREVSAVRAAKAVYEAQWQQYYQQQYQYQLALQQQAANAQQPSQSPAAPQTPPAPPQAPPADQPGAGAGAGEPPLPPPARA